MSADGARPARRPRALMVDDEPPHRRLYGGTLAAAGFEIVEAGGAAEALAALERELPDLVVSDVRMPDQDGLELLRVAHERWPQLPFLLVTGQPSVRDAVRAMKAGAVDYVAKPVDLDELAAAALDLVGCGGAPPEDDDLPAAAAAGIVAESPRFRALLRDAARAARSQATVLLTGESGTGKEVVAHFIHRVSERRDRPFVALNCAAIPAGLVASELFGHERGAFTGAVTARAGRFREADGGTLLLDEIGEMPLELQAALLRVLETGRVAALGAAGERAVDVRILAATHRRLADEVAAGRFRQDLLFRLDVVALELPPLRERREDILPLARRALREAGSPARLAPSAVRALEAYDWPGNVRELLHAVERARLLGSGEVILPEHLPAAVRAAEAAARGREREPAPAEDPLRLDELERASILRALAATGGNRTRAAERLGISRRALLYKLKRMGE